MIRICQKKKIRQVLQGVVGKAGAENRNKSGDGQERRYRTEQQAAKNGDLDIEEQTPENAMSLAEEIRQLRSEVKRLNKENKRLQEERDFLNEAAAFFAASRRK